MALVWNLNTVEYFIDGTSIDTATSNFDFGLLNGNMGFGAQFAGCCGTTFDGAFDDITIWDEALGFAEIQALAAGESPVGIESFVPEPSTAGLLSLGLGAVACRRRRRPRFRSVAS